MLEWLTVKWQQSDDSVCDEPHGRRLLLRHGLCEGEDARLPFLVEVVEGFSLLSAVQLLALMAEGRSNTAIAAALVVTLGAVEKHVAAIFMKLDLPPGNEQHDRRVMAVVQYLNS